MEGCIHRLFGTTGLRAERLDRYSNPIAISFDTSSCHVHCIRTYHALWQLKAQTWTEVFALMLAIPRTASANAKVNSNHEMKGINGWQGQHAQHVLRSFDDAMVGEIVKSCARALDLHSLLLPPVSIDLE